MADNLSPEIFGQTPWQTVGPFFHYGLTWKGGADLTGASDIGARPDLFPPENYHLALPQPKGEVEGEPIVLTGLVLDGEGRPVPDAMLEIWQADAAGCYADPTRNDGFIGFGRGATSVEGAYEFRTIRPGPTPGPDGTTQAPHIAVGVFGRGLLKRLVTRIYFEDEAANAADPILNLVPADRRDTLIARKASDTEGRAVWRLDIRLHGAGETVFFDI